MSRGRGPTLAERSAAGTAGEVVADPELVALQDRPRPVLTDGAVGYQNPRSEGSSDEVPVTLTVEQIGGEPVHRGARAVAVFAWVPWTDGRYRAVVAFAGEWTSRAVHLRWREGSGRLRDVWVWTASVRRRESGEFSRSCRDVQPHVGATITSSGVEGPAAWLVQLVGGAPLVAGAVVVAARVRFRSPLRCARCSVGFGHREGEAACSGHPPGDLDFVARVERRLLEQQAPELTRVREACALPVGPPPPENVGLFAQDCWMNSN